jgi:hypothetical protein
MKATGWSLPRVVFGGDDYGTPSHDRMGLMQIAAAERGVNMFVFDGDAIIARNTPGSEAYAQRPLDRSWEALALSNLFRGHAAAPDAAQKQSAGASAAPTMQREQAVITVKLKDPCGSADDLQARLLAVLQRLGLERADLVLLQVSHADLERQSGKGEGTRDQVKWLTARLQMLEHAVGLGLTQAYGLGYDRPFGDSLVIDEEVTVPLRAESVHAATTLTRGMAARIRSEAIRQGKPLGNTVDLSPTADTGASPAAKGRVPPPPLDPDRRYLAAVAYPASLLSYAHLFPSPNADVQTAPHQFAQWQWFQLVSTPLDCVANGKPFRCVDADPHEGEHPRRLVPLLNDSINFAIHLETKWDDEVKAQALAEEAKALPATPTEGTTGGAQTPAPSAVKVLQPRDVQWARILAPNIATMDSLLQWSFLKRRRVVPSVDKVVSAALPLAGCKEWAAAYRFVMGDVTAKIDTLLEQQHARRAATVCSMLDNALPEMFATSKSLAERALRLLLVVGPRPAIPLSAADAAMTEVPDAFGVRPRNRQMMRTAGLSAAWDEEKRHADAFWTTGRAAMPRLDQPGAGEYAVGEPTFRYKLQPLKEKFAHVMTGPAPEPSDDDPVWRDVPQQTELKPRSTG